MAFKTGKDLIHYVITNNRLIIYSSNKTKLKSHLKKSRFNYSITFTNSMSKKSFSDKMSKDSLYNYKWIH